MDCRIIDGTLGKMQKDKQIVIAIKKNVFILCAHFYFYFQSREVDA